MNTTNTHTRRDTRKHKHRVPCYACDRCSFPSSPRFSFQGDFKKAAAPSENSLTDPGNPEPCTSVTWTEMAAVSGTLTLTFNGFPVRPRADQSGGGNFQRRVQSGQKWERHVEGNVACCMFFFLSTAAICSRKCLTTLNAADTRCLCFTLLHCFLCRGGLVSKRLPRTREAFRANATGYQDFRFRLFSL